MHLSGRVAHTDKKDCNVLQLLKESHCRDHESRRYTVNGLGVSEVDIPQLENGLQLLWNGAQQGLHPCTIDNLIAELPSPSLTSVGTVVTLCDMCIHRLL